jgi:DNA-binding response OmpR family regulator
MTQLTTKLNRRILVVDDEPDVTLSLKMALEEEGFQVDAFNDPFNALSYFKIGIYDLALLDMKMPIMNGFKLHGEIKKKDNKVKVCFLTASEMYRKEFRKKEYTSFDRDVFIQKPIENDELVKQINKILNS